MTLALAIVARRPWWRRLLDALPWRRRALQPDPVAGLEIQWQRVVAFLGVDPLIDPDRARRRFDVHPRIPMPPPPDPRKD